MQPDKTGMQLPSSMLAAELYPKAELSVQPEMVKTQLLSLAVAPESKLSAVLSMQPKTAGAPHEPSSSVASLLYPTARESVHPATGYLQSKEWTRASES